MKLGVCISMYDEHDIVSQSVDEIFNCYFDKAFISVAHSKDKSNDGEIENKVDAYIPLPNLGDKYNAWQIPSFSLVRNYNEAFRMLYEFDVDFDLIVGMTGDTLITDAFNFERRWYDMQADGRFAYISQAIGHNFHSPNSDPAVGHTGGRMQYEGIHDFMPQLFFLNGKLAREKKAFTQIKVVNQYTSEHCLGDELKRVAPNDFGRFCENPNSYKDGVKYQALGKTLATGRK